MAHPMLRPDSEVIERPGWYQVVTPSAPGTHLNEVIMSDVAAEDAESTMEKVIATYGELEHPVKWCVGPWTRPEDFGALLSRRGFSSWDVRAMAMEVPRAASAPQMDRVREVSTSDLGAFVEAHCQGWSLPEDQLDAELQTHTAALTHPSARYGFFAATEGGRFVGTAGFAIDGDCAYFFGTQVLPEFRGKGLYRGLIAARLTRLAERGVSLAVTHARDATSAPILAHLGFETLFPYRCYLLDASKASPTPRD